ncbi:MULTISPECIES: hypothetical protein [Burkholderiaceae]|uniref:hypothetical protein n=1 Tax=Burkholderiaceae TaxID=119060 RepID=UPI0011155717|nr:MULTISPECIES: hypothetical protein [Burkholderiaceae]MCG1039573.1 hypothetical protein [Mycetohabitans sp. B7]
MRFDDRPLYDYTFKFMISKKRNSSKSAYHCASNVDLDSQGGAKGALCVRREFLRTLVATAGTMALAVCASSEVGAASLDRARRWPSSGAASSGSAASASSAASTTPVSVTTSSVAATSSSMSSNSYNAVSSGFFGINGHINSGNAYGTAFATQIAYMRDLGISNVRQDVWDTIGAKSIASFVDTLRGTGISVSVVITPKLSNTDEASAYSNSFQLAYSIASILKGKVLLYECGNEMEIGFVSRGGNFRTDYRATPYFIYRGMIRGMIDGVRAADPRAAVAVTAGWLHFGILQMLADGTDPQGGTSGPRVNWDVTSWHWYSDMGDITNANGIDVLHELTRRFRRPIWISEYGYRPYGQSGNTLLNAQASYLATQTRQFVKLKSQYSLLQSIQLYELFDMSADDGYGLIESDGVTKKPAYSAVKESIASSKA